MSDIINQVENEKTGEKELWITIKDASDLLNISERHAWNIITKHAFITKKLLNQSRKKTYVRQADIEKYHKDEQERQRLEALKPSSLSEMSEMSEKDPQFEISESLSERQKPISESGTALSERPKPYLDLINELRLKQETLQKEVVKYRVTVLWVSILGVVIAVMLGLFLKDTKYALSESQRALSERENALSESRKALSEMSERVLTLSEREKDALNSLLDKENYIRKLEENIPKSKLDELQAQTKGGTR